jgi:hypothetical protein
MARGRDTRLARITAKTEGIDSSETIDRTIPNALSAVRALVRRRLVERGIDPERVGALRLAPPQEMLHAADAGEEFVLSDHDGLAGVFAEKIGQVAGRYEDGREPDFANASLAELLAWCLVRGGLPARDEV